MLRLRDAFDATITSVGPAPQTLAVTVYSHSHRPPSKPRRYVAPVRPSASRTVPRHGPHSSAPHSTFFPHPNLRSHGTMSSPSPTSHSRPRAAEYFSSLPFSSSAKKFATGASSGLGKSFLSPCAPKWALLPEPVLAIIFDALLGVDGGLEGEAVIAGVRTVQMVCRNWKVGLNEMMGGLDSCSWLHQRLFEMPGDKDDFVDSVFALEKLCRIGHKWREIDLYGKPVSLSSVKAVAACLDQVRSCFGRLACAFKTNFCCSSFVFEPEVATQHEIDESWEELCALLCPR